MAFASQINSRWNSITVRILHGGPLPQIFWIHATLKTHHLLEIVVHPAVGHHRHALQHLLLLVLTHPSLLLHMWVS